MNKLMLATAVMTALCSGSLMAKEWKEVRIGVEGAYPPFSWTEPSGEVKGFDIDIANALCDEMKVKCTLIKQDWDGTDQLSMSRRSEPAVGEPSHSRKIGTAQKRAPMMNATVTFDDSSEATMPTAISIAPISQ